MELAALSFPIDFDSFHDFLVANVPNADGLCSSETGYIVIEKVTFVQTDIDAVNGYYNSLTQAGELTKSQPTLQERIGNSISLAAVFGNSLIVEYASSNVLQGITQAGKTQIVADYLRDLAYYLGNGSLYAAIAKMMDMIADTSDTKTSVSPYVTNDLLYTYLNKIQTYLEITLTPNPDA